MPESVTLPLRIVTKLVVGPAQASAAASGERPLALRFGERARFTGLLETVDGSPIPGQRIDVTQQATGWQSTPVGAVTTGADGRFAYELPAGASRVITFSYPGTAVLRSSAAASGVAVRGRGRIAVGRSVTAGRPLRVTGRLYGGYIPSGGALVQLQVPDPRGTGRVGSVRATRTDERRGPVEHQVPGRERGRRLYVSVPSVHLASEWMAVPVDDDEHRHPPRPSLKERWVASVGELRRARRRHADPDRSRA